MAAAAGISGCFPRGGAGSEALRVLDSGALLGLDPAGFHLTKQEVAEADMACVSYLIVHTAGGRTQALVWDSGCNLRRRHRCRKGRS